MRVKNWLSSLANTLRIRPNRKWRKRNAWRKRPRRFVLSWSFIVAMSFALPINELQADGPLFPVPKYPVGARPSCVTTADFNQDGITDLAAASSNVYVLLGNGDGTFGEERRIEVGGSRSVVSGDFNNDGFDDIAAASPNRNNVAILLGNGDGTFGSEQVFATGSGWAVITADFNGDGFADLATANRSSDDVSILLGIGNGTFASEYRLRTGDGPDSVIATDMNNDGIPDLVSANRNSQDISVRLGIGGGSFSFHQRYPIESHPNSITSGDFNSDGIMDLATSSWSDSNVSVMLGTGGGFSKPQVYAADAEPYTSPYSIVSADFNGDGILDLATANGAYTAASYAVILLGNGDGSFDVGERNFTVGNRPVSITAGDFNGDGATDLATANSASNDVAVLLSKGDGGFRNENQIDVGNEFYTLSIAREDFNGDGFLDLIMSAPVPNGLAVFQGVGDGSFESGKQLFTGHVSSISPADFDGDGIVDLAYAYSPSHSSRSASVRFGAGDGSFGTGVPLVNNDVPRPARVATADFNEDGFDDVAGSGTTPQLPVWLSRGDGSFQEHAIALRRAPHRVIAADFNGDGVADLATSNDSSARVSVLIAVGNAIGSGIFEPYRDINVGAISSEMAAGDFNGDGRIDLAVLNETVGQVSLLMGNGRGEFFAPQSYPVGDIPSAITTGDFDGDGVLDLAVSLRYGNDKFGAESVSVLLGRGDGTLDSPRRFASGRQPRRIIAGDFNGDGFDDLATANGHRTHDCSILLSTRGQEPTTVVPNTLIVTRGVNSSGGIDEIANSDNADFSIQRSSIDVLARTEFEVKSTSPVATPSSLSVTLEGSVFTRSQIDQTIELFNYDANNWEVVDSRAASSLSDVSIEISVADDLSRFVEGGTMCIQARISYESVIRRRRFASHTDQFFWTIGQ